MDCTYEITDIKEFVDQVTEYVESPEFFNKARNERNYIERMKILGRERKFVKSYLEFTLSIAKKFMSSEAYNRMRIDSIEAIKHFDAVALLILNKD